MLYWVCNYFWVIFGGMEEDKNWYRFYIQKNICTYVTLTLANPTANWIEETEYKKIEIEIFSVLVFISKEKAKVTKSCCQVRHY